MKQIGITTTVPVEIVLAAGLTPVDLNNVLVSDSQPEHLVAIAERAGFPLNCCSWIKGIYGVVMEKGIDEDLLSSVHGIIVPGGFGNRGIEGMVTTASYARLNNIPYLGLCLGMQVMAIEFGRYALGNKRANSTEFDHSTPYPVIDLMPEQRKVNDMGGTMRLGSYPCTLTEGTRAAEAYAENIVYERHRHRYEFNNDYLNLLGKAGLIFSGVSPDQGLVEITELKDHPWFLGCQFHPEFKSRPTRAHPLFKGFIEASLDRKEGKQ